MASLDRASARKRLAPSGEFPRTMTICDGRGGSLGLDLDCLELKALAFACHCLLDDLAPPGVSVIKVTAGEQVYLLTLPFAKARGFSGYARPNGPRWRLTAVSPPTARGALSEERAITAPCLSFFSHCQEETEGALPIAQPGACAPKGKVSRPRPAGDPVCLQIASPYEPGERVQLAPDMALLVVALVEQGLASRHGLTRQD
jgi:hypothetical protein